MISLVRRFSLLAAITAVVFPSLAQAHTGGHGDGVMHGMMHPFAGLDHWCAMLAVGIWAAQRGGRAMWALPATFLGVMALGGFLGANGVTMPWIDGGVVSSVLVLGVLIAASARMPLGVSAAMVGLFAMFHGLAHGNEMPQMTSGIGYGAGFLGASALLHAIGLSLTLVVNRAGQERIVQYAGAAMAVCGVILCLN